MSQRAGRSAWSTITATAVLRSGIGPRPEGVDARMRSISLMLDWASVAAVSTCELMYLRSGAVLDIAIALNSATTPGSRFFSRASSRSAQRWTCVSVNSGCSRRAVARSASNRMSVSRLEARWRSRRERRGFLTWRCGAAERVRAVCGRGVPSLSSTVVVAHGSSVGLLMPMGVPLGCRHAVFFAVGRGPGWYLISKSLRVNGALRLHAGAARRPFAVIRARSCQRTAPGWCSCRGLPRARGWMGRASWRRRVAGAFGAPWVRRARADDCGAGISRGSAALRGLGGGPVAWLTPATDIGMRRGRSATTRDRRMSRSSIAAAKASPPGVAEPSRMTARTGGSRRNPAVTASMAVGSTARPVSPEGWGVRPTVRRRSNMRRFVPKGRVTVGENAL